MVAVDSGRRHGRPIVSQTKGQEAACYAADSSVWIRRPGARPHRSIYRPMQASDSPTDKQTRDSFAADSLVGGMAMMLALTVIQRGLGFARGIWFCRMLDDTTVGQWAMAFGFLLLITPVMSLGLSGAMPRFVERYRLAGQLGYFIRRMILGIAVGSVIVLAMMVVAPGPWGWFVFRVSADHLLVWSLALTVATLLVFNFVIDLVSSLRQVRLNSVMQFIQGVGFTIFAVTCLYAGGGLISLLLCFALATVLGVLPGVWALSRGWSGLPVNDTAFDSRSMWRSLLPYAIALWTINLLSNLFELSDRYMILHYTAGSESVAQAAVGQYHSGRLIPMLLCNVALMYAGVLMPYLAADWESGRKDEAIRRLRRTLVISSVVGTAGSAVTLMAAPWIFETWLQGRYSEGLRVMPQAFVICIWMSLIALAQLHVWLNEKGKWVGAALAVGIAVNVVLNYLWLPVYGLDGAVLATLVSTGVVLSGLWYVMWRLDFAFDGQLVWISLLPLTLLLMPSTGAITSLLIVGLLPQFREAVAEGWRSFAERFGLSGAVAGR